jgi:exoribonuclease R
MLDRLRLVATLVVLLLQVVLLHSFVSSFQQYAAFRRRACSFPQASHYRRVLDAVPSRTKYASITSVVDDDDDSESWYRKHLVPNASSYSSIQQLEQAAVAFAASLVRQRLQAISNETSIAEMEEAFDIDMEEKSKEGANNLPVDIPPLIVGRFRDLTCTLEGEHALEHLFVNCTCEENHLLLAAVTILQSLCMMGTHVGLQGPPEKLQRLVAHLRSTEDNDNNNSDDDDDRTQPTAVGSSNAVWDDAAVRRLKYKSDRTPALQLLAALLWKRTAQGALELLVALGAWQLHEDLALLRSGFPVRFNAHELAVQHKTVDIDHVLGLRRDMRDYKVYTIDGASTVEIDDGLSIEKTERGLRVWVHIADAERWTTPELWQIARKRITSLYLPTGAIPMLPASSADVMSLQAGRDVCALSMGVKLMEDGSIDHASVTLCPSLIRVNYRLTYDDVDEMLEEGIAYNEEWQLGALLDIATKRREFRIRNGSTEGIVENPIPCCTVYIYPDDKAPDRIRISHSIDVSHNAGKNQTASAEHSSEDAESDLTPVSSSNLLVTEAMIMAGEALGYWKKKMDESKDPTYANQVLLPFRTQPKPDFMSRDREKRVADHLLEYNVGDGYCYAWYARRFLQSVQVKLVPGPHSGLGLTSYVQWTSPIRRFSDLQVHLSVKRCLRRQKVAAMIASGKDIPFEVKDHDLGLPEGSLQSAKLLSEIIVEDLDQDINLLEGVGLVGAARTLQRQSQQYWLFEYIRRLQVDDPDRIFPGVVLGCVDPYKRQYAIFLPTLGMEHRYTSPGGQLDPGLKLRLKVDKVLPRANSLRFVRVV